MQVAATHAALLLAQGAGRLIRTTTDRGVVAVLDPRLVTARYGGFLRASLPPMWSTTDRDRGASRRCDGSPPDAGRPRAASTHAAEPLVVVALVRIACLVGAAEAEGTPAGHLGAPHADAVAR